MWLTIISFLLGISLSRIGTLAGTVTDEETGYPLAGANLILAPVLDSLASIVNILGDAADNDGYFKISHIPPGRYRLKATMIGYEEISIPVEIFIDEKRRLDVRMKETVIPLEKVVVHGDVPTELSQDDLSDYEIREVPGAATDLFFALQSLPGVSSLGDAGPISIRGGDPQENLYLFDNAPIGSPFHMEYVAGGLFNLFDQSMLKEVNLYSGGFPAKYGDRLSAVIDIQGRDGSREEMKGEATLSMAGATGLVEGPLSEKGSFRLMGRRTYYDWVIGLIEVPEEFRVFPTYYDIQGRLDYDLSKKHKFVSNLLNGEDWMRLVLDEPNLTGEFDWRSRKRLASIGLESILSPKLYSNFTFSLMDNQWRVKLGDDYYENIDQKEYTIWEDLTYELSPRHTLGLGFSLHPVQEKWHSFTLASEPNQPEEFDTLVYNLEIDSYKGASYLEDRFRIFPDLTLRIGGRLDYFDVTGEKQLSPRFSLSYKATDKLTLQVSGGKYTQFPNEDKESHPSYVPFLQSKKATHFVLGMNYEWRKHVQSRVEVYSKRLRNLYLDNPNLNHDTNDGYGYSRGVEFLLHKKFRGNTFGWLSYSYSISKRKEGKDEELLDFDYDQRQLFNLVATQKLARAWQVGLKWRFASGRPFTPLRDRVLNPESGEWEPIWAERKSSRYPSYHRLDLRMEREFILFRWRTVIFLEVMNLYNRKNVVWYEYNNDYSELEPFTIFQFLPVGGVIISF